ncbi:probable chitinase 10, partial [Contarinia nasturtii]|uniref:probable chitinase 10 n=1 Tax=Contarinia nasturtii TaxID=265458 RepID=UPI0012D42133
MKFVGIFILVVLVIFVSAQNHQDNEVSEVKSLTDDDVKVVCYFTNWSWYRQGIGKYSPEDIDSHLCTHIVYGFASLDANTLTIKTYDSWVDIDNHFYQRVTAYHQKGIKILIAIGGWNDSTEKYSRLLTNSSARHKFIESVIDFIGKYNFQGLDLDLEYPGCWQGSCRDSSAQDRHGFSQFIQELSEAFKPHNYLLSAAVSPKKQIIDIAYDVPILSQYLDWIALMAYDYHGSWDRSTGQNAPLYYYPGDTAFSTA